MMLRKVFDIVQKFGNDYGAFGLSRVRLVYPYLLSGRRVHDAVFLPFSEQYRDLFPYFRKFSLDIDPETLGAEHKEIFYQIRPSVMVYKIGNLSPVIDKEFIASLKDAGWFIVGVFENLPPEQIIEFPATFRVIRYRDVSFCTTNIYSIARFAGFFDEPPHNALVDRLQELIENPECYSPDVVETLYAQLSVDHFYVYKGATLLDAIIRPRDKEARGLIHGKLSDAGIECYIYDAPKIRVFGGYSEERGRFVFVPPDGHMMLSKTAVIIPNRVVGANFSKIVETLSEVGCHTPTH